MEVIGYIAGTLTTFAFIPQVVRIFRTRSADDLSWWWLALSLVGIVLWLLYGVSIRNYPMTLFNVITFALIASLGVAKYRFRGDGVVEAVEDFGD